MNTIPRVRNFMWLARLDRLLTNKARTTRQITDNPGIDVVRPWKTLCMCCVIVKRLKTFGSNSFPLISQVSSSSLIWYNGSILICLIPVDLMEVLLLLPGTCLFVRLVGSYGTGEINRFFNRISNCLPTVKKRALRAPLSKNMQQLVNPSLMLTPRLKKTLLGPSLPIVG